MQPEEERGHAVGEPHRDHSSGTADVEREPHQRDVVERVAELARGDGEVHPSEVRAVEQVERARRGRRRLQLTRNVEDGIGHEAPSIAGLRCLS